MNEHDVWWTGDHLSICTQWLLQNPSSSVTDAFDVIRSDIVTIVTNFYNLMMDQTGLFMKSKDAWQIHLFLSLRRSLLQNQFLFFEQNEEKKHWTSSCICNPWFSVLQWKKNKPGAELTEALEALDVNQYINGWLMFDPQKGYIKEKVMNAKYKKFRDVNVWLLNMASLYEDCCIEDTFQNLNFLPNIFCRNKGLIN